jgi:hypothetical protein
MEEILCTNKDRKLFNYIDGECIDGEFAEWVEMNDDIMGDYLLLRLYEKDENVPNKVEYLAKIKNNKKRKVNWKIISNQSVRLT